MTLQMTSVKCHVTGNQSNMKNISVRIIRDLFGREMLKHFNKQSDIAQLYFRDLKIALKEFYELQDAFRWRVQREEPATLEKVLTRVEINGNMVYVVGHRDCLAPNAEWRPIIEIE